LEDLLFLNVTAVFMFQLPISGIQSHNSELTREHHEESESVKAMESLYQVTKARMEATKDLKAQ